MRIVISGASGFVGSHLIPFLQNCGHTVEKLPRHATDKSLLEGADALINLSGESIVTGLWTAAKKERMRKSRIETTENLSRMIRELQYPPKIFLSASAIGWYGSRGDELLNEESERGESFLSDLCQEWEEAAIALRVVNLRIGVVLDPNGGMLKKLLPIFKLGLGGKIGNGKQWVSWIAMRDLMRAIEFLLQNEVRGPVNMVAPHPVTNGEMTKVLGKVLRRPTFCRVPGWILKLLLGEMAEETMLASQRVEPKKLLEAGFQFECSSIEQALKLS